MRHRKNHTSVAHFWVVRHRKGLFCGAPALVRHRKKVGPTSVDQVGNIWPYSVAHPTRCATEMQHSVAHPIQCATKWVISVAHAPRAPQKYNILWRTCRGAPQNVAFLWRTGRGAPQKVHGRSKKVAPRTYPFTFPISLLSPSC